ncbi:PIN domain-containing protein [Candidatus Micrarchaeota archaeon]|nr:PIN domain-containing protein [Candidatus Micrarchaeota archaeon]
MPTCFVDTNILVYAVDYASKDKNLVASKLVSDAFSGESELVLSNQVLAEFLFVSTKRGYLDSESLERMARDMLQSEQFIKLSYSFSAILSAARNCGSSKRFWDALIAATMAENGLDTIITENEKDFQSLGLKTINPFKKALA